MRIDLGGKRAIVTGSTGGIGFAIAEGLARTGATVIVNGRGRARTEAAAAKLREAVAGAAIEPVAGDLGDAEGCETFLRAAGEADILVNNLGIYAMTPFQEIEDADWQRFFDVNVMSGVRLSRHLAPRMQAKGWGRIVFISSESGLNIPKEMIHYGFSKTAQLAISRGLAESLAGTGVTVNAVLPGPTMSEGVETLLAGMAKEAGVTIEEAGRRFVAEHRPSSLLGRMATCDEVANMVVYACSEQAAATSGAALRVDGGVLRAIG